MSILCCQNAFKIIQNLLQNCLNMVLTPPPFLNNVQKTAHLEDEGTPNPLHTKDTFCRGFQASNWHNIHCKYQVYRLL